MNSKVILVVVLLFLVGCKKKDDPEPQLTEEEIVTNLLVSGGASWKPQTTSGITLAGVDVTTELFKDFTIKFTSNQIVTTGTTPVWLRQDTWKFKTGSTSVIIRGQDNKEVTITSISETELKLSLEWDKTTYEDGGRTASLPGKYEFVMTK